MHLSSSNRYSPVILTVCFIYEGMLIILLLVVKILFNVSKVFKGIYLQQMVGNQKHVQRPQPVNLVQLLSSTVC